MVENVTASLQQSLGGSAFIIQTKPSSIEIIGRLAGEAEEAGVTLNDSARGRGS